MKPKIKILIVSCVIAAAAISGFNLAQEQINMGISLADIAMMAKADDGEEPTITCNTGGEGMCWWCERERRHVPGYGWSECNIGCSWSGYQEDSCSASGDCYPGGCITL